MKIIYLLLLTCWLPVCTITSQTPNVRPLDCEPGASDIYGEVFIDEAAENIIYTPSGDIYIAGTREDNSLLIKLDTATNVIWAREFNIVKDKSEHPSCLTLDSDGLLVISGVGGSIHQGGTMFAFRYDPDNDVILWSKEYTQSPNDISYGHIEKSPDGNFLLFGQAVHFSINNNYAQVFEIDRQSGALNPTFAKNYQIIGTETLYEMAMHNGALYGVGRYKDVGPTMLQMRNTLTRLNPVDGDQLWVKMGHRSPSLDARLYGVAMVIRDNTIYSVYWGDPIGHTTTSTKIYIQRTDLNGNLVWLNQYELPGENDFVREIIAVDDGLIALAYQNTTDDYYMFKIDGEGNLLWAKKYEVPDAMLVIGPDFGNQEIISTTSELWFVGSGINDEGDSDIIVFRTDHEGNATGHCIVSEDAPIVVNSVQNPVWYDKEVNQFDVDPDEFLSATIAVQVELPFSQGCQPADTIFTTVETTICEGQSFEGYTESGIYQDTFQTQAGCDSIRILTLEVIPAITTTVYRELCAGETFLGYSQTGVYTDTFELLSGCDSIRTLRLVVFSCEPIVYYDLDACRSYMSDGSIMDYSEFDPEYPNGLDCGDVSASVLYREPPAENKHSCTPGLEGSLAMCISSLNSCIYQPGHDASAVFEITFTPDADSTIVFNKLEFYEKAPTTYTWIDGPSGVNNYPRYYGIRILRNGTQVFEQHDIATSQTWALQSYVFNNEESYRITEPTTFRIELLPYCPIGNGADVSAWDLENLRVFASCAPELPDDLFVGGVVKRWNDKPVFPTTMYISQQPDFTNAMTTEVDLGGHYSLSGLAPYSSYYVRAENNHNLLLGVTTSDIIALQKHLLGKQPLTTLDQYIAADINHNNKINALDMIDLRKAILGVVDEFPNNTSWRFGTMPVNTGSPHMHDFGEVYYIESLFESVTDVDFMGVKIGDINRDLRFNFDSEEDIVIRSANPFVMDITERPNTSEGIHILDVTANEAVQLEGLQMAVTLKGMELLNVLQGSLALREEHYHLDEAGVLRISWSDLGSAQHVGGELLFSIVVKSHGAIQVAQRVRLSDVLKAEVYTTLAENRPVEIKVNGSGIRSMMIFPGMEIAPNPFSNEFTVSFTVPVEDNVNIKVFTPLGEQIVDEDATYPAGQHTRTIQLSQYKGAQGLLFCQLTYGKHAQTKRVLKL